MQRATSETNSMLPYEATTDNGLVTTLTSHSSIILYRGPDPHLTVMVPSIWGNNLSMTYFLANGIYHVPFVPRNPFSYWVPAGFLTNTLTPVMHFSGHSVPSSHFSWNWANPVINHIPRFSEENHGPSHMPPHRMPLHRMPLHRMPLHRMPPHRMPLRTSSPRMDLLANQDQVYNVSTGLSREVIFACMKCIKYESFVRCTSNNDTCCICLNEYSDGQDIGSIDCQHTFHSDCISQWLMLKNSCPLCRRIALTN